MAIIKCSNCGGNVSDRAKVCPHCGILLTQEIASPPYRERPQLKRAKPIENKPKRAAAIVVGFIVASVLALVAGGTALWLYVIKPNFYSTVGDLITEAAELYEGSDVAPVVTDDVVSAVPVEEHSSVNETTSAESEVYSAVEAAKEAAAEVVAEAASAMISEQFLLRGNMAGFPMTIKVVLRNGYPGKCSGIYQNIKYKTKMNVSGVFEDSQLQLIGYADGTSYSFKLSTNDFISYNGYCETGEGKTLNVSLEKK